MQRKFQLLHSLVLATFAALALAAVSPSAVLAQGQPSAQTTTAPSEATIKTLQEALNKQGIAVKADGVLNDETRAAIRKYQQQHHLPITGDPDQATLSKLGVSARSVAGPALAQATTPPSGTTPQSQPQQTPQMPMQGGMMMNCPMMQGQMQMMQGQMQAMMQMMQGMMQMMQTMQGQTPMQPGQVQPGQMPTPPMQPGQMPMQPGQTQPGQMQPGTR